MVVNGNSILSIDTLVHWGPSLHSNLQISTGGSTNHRSLTFEPVRKGKCCSRHGSQWSGCSSGLHKFLELYGLTCHGVWRFTLAKMHHVVKRLDLRFFEFAVLCLSKKTPNPLKNYLWCISKTSVAFSSRSWKCTACVNIAAAKFKNLLPTDALHSFHSYLTFQPSYVNLHFTLLDFWKRLVLCSFSFFFFFSSDI